MLLPPPHIGVALPPGEEVRSEVIGHVVHVRSVPGRWLSPAAAAYKLAVFAFQLQFMFTLNDLCCCLTLCSMICTINECSPDNRYAGLCSRYLWSPVVFHLGSNPSTRFDWNSEWKPSPWLPRPCSENSERKELARRRTQTRLLLTLRALHVLQVHQVLHVHHHLLLLHVFHPFLLLHQKYSPASWSTLQCWSLPKGQRSCNAVFKTNNSFGLGQKCYLDVISINIFQKVFLPLWREPWPVVAMALILRKLDNNGCGICFHVTDVGTIMMSKCHSSASSALSIYININFEGKPI